jgi:multidrug efflux pump subunit AcrA (membrane-fusion protein)
MPFDKDDPDFKAALKAASDEAKAALQVEIDKLKTKNQELIAENREAKKGQQIDPAKYAALEDKVAELTDQLSTAQAETAKQIKALTTERDAFAKKYDGEKAANYKSVVETGLTNALVEAKVDPIYLPFVKAKMQSDVKVVEDGELRKAVVGDKALAEFVKEWAASDEAKNFIQARSDGGGNANGSNKQNGLVTISASDSAAFGTNLAEIAKGEKGTVRIAP